VGATIGPTAGLRSRADAALPEGCSAEDEGGEAEAGGGSGECDFFGPCVGVVHECLGAAIGPTSVGATGATSEFVVDGGGGDGGGEFAGFGVEGARAGEVGPEADGGGQYDGDEGHGEESLHGAVVSWLLSIFTTQFPLNSHCPDPVGRSNRLEPARSVGSLRYWYRRGGKLG